MKNMIRNTLIGAVSMLAVAGVANAVTVSLTPPVTNVAVGDSFTLTIEGSDFFNDVSAGGALITWDTNLLQLDSTLTDIANSAAANGFPVDFGLNSLIPGQLEATFSTFGTVPGPVFDFFSMTFTATPPPGQTGVDIGIGFFGDWQDGAGVAIPSASITFNPAEINVSAVPVPAAVWLFGSGLLGMVGVARRRSRS